MDTPQIVTFFGWTSVINIGILFLATMMLTAFKGTISKIHSKLFLVNEDDLYLTYLRFLGTYKLLIIIFSVVPYFALKVML